jgi:hypothetical protein
MVSCNLGVMGLLLSAEDLPPSSIFFFFFFFFFAPFLSVRCNPELVGLLLVHRRSPTEAHLCTVLQAFLGPQVFFCPQKISCLCPSLQVLQSFFGIVGFLLCTEDLPLKPISAGHASFLGTAGLLLPTEDLLPMPISAGLANL